MEDQYNRIYFDIIDCVCSKLSEDGHTHDIDGKKIFDLQREWVKNLEIAHNNLNKNMVEQIEKHKQTGKLIGDIDSNGSSFEDDMDNIEENISCYMMCLFVKVAKSKNKWKCTFKQGFVNVGGEDIPFSNATGELDW